MSDLFEVQGYPSHTLPLVRTDDTLLHEDVAGPSGHSPFFPPTRMTWTPTATRADVVRMVARYVRLEFSIRSGAGNLVIDESRTAKRRSAKIDLDNLSYEETMDAIVVGQLRQAIYAKPEAPQHLSTHPDSRGYYPLRRVAPLRDVADIIRSRHKVGGGSQQHDAREWRATVAQKMQRLDRGAEADLLEAEHLRLGLKETRNKLEQERRTAGRLKNGGRNARNLRRHADTRVDELRSKEQRDAERLKFIVRTSAYRDGIDALLEICTETEEVETYLFKVS